MDGRGVYTSTVEQKLYTICKQIILLDTISPSFIFRRGLENVTDVEDAQRANLNCKERLDSLVLEWSYSSDTRETEYVVLDMLQPHTKLKELTIKSYAGKEFSSWVGVLLSLIWCSCA
ncbi:hypothetical protein DVH24_038045 [Malus domestica]|uniref:R13L1/DRL21-like LRR repeat region domain-containing protein n=1 Tax=Malus domestica TaxID=3750 RepID=A0A498K8C0_MALDO|nr:hypothetical protein DVH24_038045 [Malus domestica]